MFDEEKKAVEKIRSDICSDLDAEALYMAYLTAETIDRLPPKTTISDGISSALISMAKNPDHCKRVVAKFLKKIADED